jgi:hypothetical protein
MMMMILRMMMGIMMMMMILRITMMSLMKERLKIITKIKMTKMLRLMMII